MLNAPWSFQNYECLFAIILRKQNNDNDFNVFQTYILKLY